MLVDVFGWRDVFAGRPKLAAWWEALQGDAAAVKVRRGAQSAGGPRARPTQAACCQGRV